MPTFRSNKIPIAVTMGDPGGIGPEVIVKSFASRFFKSQKRKIEGDFLFFCVGDFNLLQQIKEDAGLSVRLKKTPFRIRPGKQYQTLQFQLQDAHENTLNVLDIAKGDYTFSKPSFQNARAALDAITLAASSAHQKKFAAVVTAPVHKHSCQKVNKHFFGHTELLAEIDKKKKFAMMLVGGGLQVVLNSIHVPLSKVPAMTTKRSVSDKINLISQYAKKNTPIQNPRIAVCGLNPHAGEEGLLGKEDQEEIAPAVQAAKKRGIRVEGPLPADTLFYHALKKEYDYVLAMYHDQGLAPLKMIGFEEGVNTTLGLSFVRTSPDHGTAFDIAYQNKANPLSMTHAILNAMRAAYERQKKDPA